MLFKRNKGTKPVKPGKIEPARQSIFADVPPQELLRLKRIFAFSVIGTDIPVAMVCKYFDMPLGLEILLWFVLPLIPLGLIFFTSIGDKLKG